MKLEYGKEVIEVVGVMEGVRVREVVFVMRGLVKAVRGGVMEDEAKIGLAVDVRMNVPNV